MKEKDYLNGDHSFKMWFSIMWRNFYVQLFLIALFAIIFLCIMFDEEKTIAFYVALAIPVLAAVIIAYKGFYQFWNDLKNNRSR